MPKKSYNYLVKTGRPRKFKPELTQQLIEFFDIEPIKKEVMETVTEYKADGTPKKTAEKFKHVPSKMPTLLRFAMKHKLNYETLNRWAHEGEDPEYFDTLKSAPNSKAHLKLKKDLAEFSKAYKTAKELQKDWLISVGLHGAAPPSSFIFTAKNVTDMRDRVESEVTVREVKPLLDNLRTKKLPDSDVKRVDGEEVKVIEHQD